MGKTPRAGVIPGPGKHSPLGYHVSGKRGRHTKRTRPLPQAIRNNRGKVLTAREAHPPAAGVTSPASRGTVARAKKSGCRALEYSHGHGCRAV